MTSPTDPFQNPNSADGAAEQPWENAADPNAYAQPGYDQYQQNTYQQNAADPNAYAQQGYAQPGYQQNAYQQPVYNGAPIPGQKSKIAAGILGIFLGAFGIHNFYLGYTGKAVAQLLITVLSVGVLSPISGLWGFIEGILILVAQPGTQPWGVDANNIPLSN